jgi:hypothetical protein
VEGRGAFEGTARPAAAQVLCLHAHVCTSCVPQASRSRQPRPLLPATAGRVISQHRVCALMHDSIAARFHVGSLLLVCSDDYGGVPLHPIDVLDIRTGALLAALVDHNLVSDMGRAFRSELPRS